MNHALTNRTLMLFVCTISIAAADLLAEQNPLNSIDQFKQRSGIDPTVAISPQTVTSSPDDIYWDNSISPTLGGIDGYVNAAIVYNGSLIVAGQFNVAGGAIASNIAAWDGHAWSSLGSGLNGAVTQLGLYGNKLVATGQFTASGGTPAQHLAFWNGSSWSQVGSGLDGAVTAMVEYGGKLIVGEYNGELLHHEVAAWNGTSWSSLGSDIRGEFNGDVFVTALTVFDGKLIAAGYFDTAGTVPAANIAAWDGSSWSAIGPGLTGGVYSLTVYDSTLVASGHFDTTDEIPQYYNVSRWDGQKWSIVGDGLNLSPTTLTAYSGNLIAGGKNLGVRMWNGGTWASLGGTDLNDVSTVIIYNNQLIAIESNLFSRVDKWDGASWLPIEFSGPDYLQFPKCIAVYNDRLIAGGNFTSIGGVEAYHIAQWDGNSWSPVGTGTDGAVNALAVYDNKLIASGDFGWAGGVAAKFVAAWDGSSWSPLGSGPFDDSSHILSTMALQVYGDKLYVGGYSYYDGFAGANLVASWDGSTWTSLGKFLDINYTEYAEVDAFTVFDGKLIAGGYFGQVGGVPTTNIAAWDGSAWTPVGTGVRTGIIAMTTYDGNLIASTFDTIASWNGTSWSPIGVFGSNTEYGFAGTFTVYGNHLIAGGYFSTAKGISANGLSSWDGHTWSTLGSGIGGSYPEVSALAEYHNALYVGGSFTTAGNKVSALFAKWAKSPTDVNEGGQNGLPHSFSLSQNYPNPFNPSTQIQFTLPSRSHVSIEIFNLLGQSVRQLINESRSAGTYTTTWDGKDNAGHPMPTGVYLYRLQSPDFQESRKMILLK